MGNTAASLENNDQAVIKTSRFGEIKINEDKIITLTSPILGFPEDDKFVLLPHGEDSVFFWFQSVKSPSLAFVVIQPKLIKPNYKPIISKAVRSELQVNELLDIMVILTIPAGKPEEMTANLLGPLVFNAEKRLAKQILLDSAEYDPCWPVRFS